MVTAGTRWGPGRSKQMLQKTGGSPGLPRAPGAPGSTAGADLELMAPPIPGFAAPRSGMDSRYRCDAIGVTSPAVPLPRDGTPHHAQPQGKLIPAPALGNRSQGMRTGDHPGCSPWKEHPLGLGSRVRISLRG